MPRFLSKRSLFVATVSIAAICTSPALAQVSAVELWSDWQETAAASGQDIAAEATETANGLVLENLVSRTESDGVVTTASVDRVEMIENGDGSLSIDVSNPYSMSISFTDEAEDWDGTIELFLTHEGLDVSVTGGSDSRTYVYSADAITVAEGPITSASGGAIPEIDLEIVARDLATTYVLEGSDPNSQRFSSNGTTGTLAGRIDVVPPPGEEGFFKMSFALGEMQTEASGTIVALTTMQQVEAGLPEDFEVSGTSEYGWSRVEVLLDSPEGSFNAFFGNDGGSVGVALSEEELSYSVSAQGMATRVSGNEIPVPVEASASSSELALTVPLAASDTPSDAAVRIAYRDLAVSEGLWSMIDPTGQVPRNPLTLILDAAAQVQVAVDLTSPDAMEMQAPPGELRSLTVSELELSFGETSLTGTAAMTFAPGQLVPQPVGQAELALSGGNALLESLQAAGLVSADEAGMARGVAGMFTRPGAGPDTLETTIEFLPGGGITANGVTIQ